MRDGEGCESEGRKTLLSNIFTTVSSSSVAKGGGQIVNTDDAQQIRREGGGPREIDLRCLSLPSFGFSCGWMRSSFLSTLPRDERLDNSRAP